MTISQENFVKVNQYLHGHIITQLITTAVKIGLFDQLHKGSWDEQNLALFLQIDIQIMRRYVRALEGLGLIIRSEDDRLSISDLGSLICNEGSIYGNAVLCGDYYYGAWTELEYSLKTGSSAFKHHHQHDIWQIMDKNPQTAEVFSKAMRANTEPVSSELLQDYNFSSTGVIADLGAGDGILLARILEKNPNLRGIAVEQKSMLSCLENTLHEVGVAERCEIICADLLKPMVLQADVFMLKSVLHNWSDKDTLQILKNCAMNLRKSDRLLILERAMDPEHPNKLGMAMLDLTMLVLFGSQDRDKTQYRELVEKAELQITKEFWTATGILVIEAGLKA